MIKRMVILGASGDLTSRLLLPAVAQLAATHSLPPDFTVIGASNLDWSTADFRAHIAVGLETQGGVSASTKAAVLETLSFRTCDVTSPEELRSLLGQDHPETLVYLALPTSLLVTVLETLSTCGLHTTDALAIEKPFGTDLESAQQLNNIIRLHLPEPTVFRVDHFLSNDLVRRIASVRFLNRVFEPTLNSAFVERVDISWLESLTLEGRAAYYDNAGAVKDMLQNHLMEVMALVLMEQPARLDAHSFRDVRVEALRAVATPVDAQMPTHTVRARYRRGAVGTRVVPSYVDEPGVDPQRNTETYASLTLAVDNVRWEGVPFTLRSGKALPHASAEIAVHFRPMPRHLTDQWPGAEPNVLRIGLMEPYVRLAATLNGPERTAKTRELQVTSAPPPLTAYANLLREMLDKDPMLFIRSDEAEESWRIVDPVMKAWAAGDVPMQEYDAGTAPPGPIK